MKADIVTKLIIHQGSQCHLMGGEYDNEKSRSVVMYVERGEISQRVCEALRQGVSYSKLNFHGKNMI